MKPVLNFKALVASSLCVTLGCVGVDDASPERDVAALTQLRRFGTNPGNLLAYVYAPRDVAASAPLVVVLHGCTQTASDYTAAGWNELAEQWKFYVLYAEQQTANNNNRCFNWFDVNDTTRGQGEALSIRQMIETVTTTYSIASQKIFVTGLSAGGAMTAVMLATYPDVFAAGAVMAGLPYACATSTNEAFMCMNPGVNRTPLAWGDLVRAQLPGYAGTYPRVSIWAGDRDTTVRPNNVTELADQWTQVHGLDAVSDRMSVVEGATRNEHVSQSGEVRVETWIVPNMTHGTAIRPGDTRAAGCGRAGAYILSAGICSTYHAARFFGLEPATIATPDAGTDAGVDVVISDSSVDVSTTDSQPDASVSDVLPDASPDTVTTCREYNDTNWQHVMTGRATRCGVGGSYVCANGSGTQVGLWTLTRSWLREPRAGWFEPGRCP
jgi:poly(hydroxyalkanoate) depolymerase family esterase